MCAHPRLANYITKIFHNSTKFLYGCHSNRIYHIFPNFSAEQISGRGRQLEIQYNG